MVVKQKYLLLLFFSCLFFLGLPVQTKAEEVLGSSVYVDDYRVEMQVNPDHSYAITEKIRMNFGEDRQGIRRIIPFTGTFVRNYTD